MFCDLLKYWRGVAGSLQGAPRNLRREKASYKSEKSPVVSYITADLEERIARLLLNMNPVISP
jgi:hypothetical protein